MHGTVKGKTSRPSLGDLFRGVRSYTEFLCEPLEIEDYIPQPSVDVSPAKWNIAHTTWFFEEMVLKKFYPGYEEFDRNFGFLFNSYYNSVGDRTLRMNRGDLSRPTVARVFEYRRHVDDRMMELFNEALSDEAATLIELGLNHEQQHQELLITDLKYTLGQNPIFPIYRDGYAPEEDPDDGSEDWIDLGGGMYDIGHDGSGFCFDNELARHKVYLNDVSIKSRLVTNADLIEFIDDGGYRDFRFWHSEGWDWVCQNNIESPLHWHNRDGDWHSFTLSGLRKLADDAPVCHVSFYEAAAFAEWKGMRLPTESEWEAASERLNWGKRWEWTNSAYLPYPGFTRPPGAVGEYNGKFMINQMVLRGASVVTPAGHSRNTYRNFFHPHLRWQFTGIRLAR